MSDNNENTTTDAAAADVQDGILDLRPPKSGIVYQLLRLGLTFDHKDADGETWCDYSRGVTATFTSRDAQEATIADMDTKDAETITASKLAQVTTIKTWRSDGAED
jgi:hypothetical protein